MNNIIQNPILNETNEFQDEPAQPIFIGEHKEDPQNSLDHLKMGFGIKTTEVVNTFRKKFFFLSITIPFLQYYKSRINQFTTKTAKLTRFRNPRAYYHSDKRVNNYYYKVKLNIGTDATILQVLLYRT